MCPVQTVTYVSGRSLNLEAVCAVRIWVAEHSTKWRNLLIRVLKIGSALACCGTSDTADQQVIGKRDRSWITDRFVPNELSGTVDSQFTDDLHEGVHFSIHGRFGAFQVLLHADAREEGQDHLRQRGWFHRGLLGFDISRDEVFEKSAAL